MVSIGAVKFVKILLQSILTKNVPAKAMDRQVCCAQNLSA